MTLISAFLLIALLGIVDSVLAAADDAFDFIIVGGGTAGIALATRLSQGLPHTSILVLEAGPLALDELGINVPGLKGSTFGGKYDWNFTTVPQPHLNGRVLAITRGKVVGGSSAINLMAWDRGAAAEYDQWEEVGNHGWNWDSMVKAMTKSENYSGSPPRPGAGHSGPIHNLVNRFQPEYQDAWIPAVTNSFHIAENHDSLNGSLLGVTFQPTNIYSSTHYNRSYSAVAYLPLAHSNLEVLPRTQVARINFSPHHHGNRRATSVTLTNGTTIPARREIILSAGAIQTPQMLELSGIGQPSVLRAANITPIIPLPGVGSNYQDHPRVQMSFQLKPNYTSGDILKYDAQFAAAEFDKWLSGRKSWYDDRRGPFLFANWAQISTPDNDVASRLVRLAHEVVGENSTDVGHRKKLEQLANPSIPQVEIILSDGYNGRNGYPARNSTHYGENFASFIIVLLHPLSRGSVHINASDPGGKPVIDPQFLDNEYDVQAFVEAAKFTRRLASAEPLRSLWVREHEPGAALREWDDDGRWREWVRENMLTVCHPSGTAPMLPRGKGGVVDSELVVYGTENLRVVDWSLMPVQISGHPQTAVYGIAERAAEIIIDTNS